MIICGLKKMLGLHRQTNSEVDSMLESVRISNAEQSRVNSSAGLLFTNILSSSESDFSFNRLLKWSNRIFIIHYNKISSYTKRPNKKVAFQTFKSSLKSPQNEICSRAGYSSSHLVVPTNFRILTGQHISCKHVLFTFNSGHRRAERAIAAKRAAQYVGTICPCGPSDRCRCRGDERR